MSSNSQGPSQSDDLSTTLNHSDSNITSVHTNTNTINKSVTKCYNTTNTNVSSHNKITSHFKPVIMNKSLTSNEIISSLAPTSSSADPEHSSSFHLPVRRRTGRHPCKLSHYLAASNIQPKQGAPHTPPPPPRAPPFHGPNPYHKQHNVDQVKTAITQLEQCDSSLSHTSSDTSVYTRSSQPPPRRVFHTRTRTIHPPQRYGFSTLSAASSSYDEESNDSTFPLASKTTRRTTY